MTAPRSSTWRSLAFITALATALALTIPFGTALASHSGVPTTAAHDLDAVNGSIAAPTTETASNPTGTTHTVTATVADCPASAIDAICEVDWEFESGPAVTILSEGGAAVSRASDDGNTPLTPDATCIINEIGLVNPEANTTACSISFTSGTAGAVLVRAFVDDDRNNSTNNNVELDTAEGRNEVTTPGDVSEADDTDAIEKTFFAALGAQVVLDCSPERPLNPSTGADSSETFTCQLWNNNGTPANLLDDTQNTTAGLKIDGENDNGANDPDNAGFATAGNVTGDYNDIGTTDASGTATVTIPASEGQAATNTYLCFWVDIDSDAVYADGGTAEDGLNCNEATELAPETATPSRVGDGDSDRDDTTDVVNKRWRAIGQPASLTVTPSSDQNLHGTTHTVTASVLDAFGTPVVGARVDIAVTAGHNLGQAGTTNNDAFTNASGQATLTYADGNTDSTPGAADTITACVDNDSTNVPPATGGCDAAATTATASKFWFVTLPTVDEVILDMQTDDALPASLGGAGADVCPDGATDTNAAAVNIVDTVHEVCAQVENAANAGIQGAEVTFTVDAPAYFTDALGTDYGQSFTVGADADGEASAAIYSTAAGTFTVTATSGGKSDSGTKTYRGDVARNIDCEPETQDAAPGDQTVATCTVTDRFGNPSQDTNSDLAITGTDLVAVSETGPGFLVSAAAPAVGAAGTFEIRVQTASSESGVQTISAELADDFGGDAVGGAPDADTAADVDDPCDQAAGNLAAEEADDSDTDVDGGTAPAGACEDSVTVDWAVQPITECSDGQDNDFDGDIDFPADNGCADADDDDESDEAITETDHDVSVSIDKFKKVNLGGGKKSLKVKGSVTSDFETCFNQTFVKLQLRAGGEWVTRKTDITSATGIWKVLVRHVKGKYRAVVPKFSIFGEDTIDNCLRATDVRRYS